MREMTARLRPFGYHSPAEVARTSASRGSNALSYKHLVVYDRSLPFRLWAFARAFHRGFLYRVEPLFEDRHCLRGVKYPGLNELSVVGFEA